MIEVVNGNSGGCDSVTKLNWSETGSSRIMQQSKRANQTKWLAHCQSLLTSVTRGGKTALVALSRVDETRNRIALLDIVHGNAG